MSEAFRRIDGRDISVGRTSFPPLVTCGHMADQVPEPEPTFSVSIESTRVPREITTAHQNQRPRLSRLRPF